MPEGSFLQAGLAWCGEAQEDVCCVLPGETRERVRPAAGDETRPSKAWGRKGPLDGLAADPAPPPCSHLKEAGAPQAASLTPLLRRGARQRIPSASLFPGALPHSLELSPAAGQRNALDACRGAAARPADSPARLGLTHLLAQRRGSRGALAAPRGHCGAGGTGEQQPLVTERLWAASGGVRRHLPRTEACRKPDASPPPMWRREEGPTDMSLLAPDS